MKKWFFSCNLNKYDILGSFLKNGFVDYGTNLNITEGDDVYIYTGSPYSDIFLKCRVRAILNSNEIIDDNEFVESNNKLVDKAKYVRLIPTVNYLNKIDKVGYSVLNDNGLKGASYQIEVPDQLGKYLDSI
ncbi:MAG: hypothetical protein ACRC7N_13670 [Clostridium sp.]